MEFLVFALLNLVTGLVLYVLFSLRLQAWQEKIRTAHPLQKDVEENIRQGLQSMNEYLEEMQETRNNFYQLLRHAEEVTQKLDKAGKRRPRKPTSISPGPKQQPDAPPVEEGTEHIGRILDRMKPDSVDLSTRPDTSKPRSNPPQTETKPGPIDGLGRLAASLFGMKSFELPFRDSPRAPTGAENSNEETTSSGEQSRARDQVDSSLPASIPVHLPEAVADMPASGSTRKRPELNLPDESSPELIAPEGDPHSWIRNLIANGMTAGDVSRLTGKSLAEIELIASLPQMPVAPRRKRLGGDGS
ncbi:MAG: hypothetical protein JNM27_13295 [Leptospirales bacterium]|nr:hypothetical protein [Leptospirales bacterium]